MKNKKNFWLIICFITLTGCVAKEENLSTPHLIREETSEVSPASSEEVKPQQESDGEAIIIEEQKPVEDPIIRKGQEHIAGEWVSDEAENHGTQQIWLDTFITELEKEPVSAVLLVKDGCIIYENYQDDYQVDSQFNLFSCTKSIVRRRITIGCNSKLKSRLTPIRPRGLACNCTFLSA